MSQRTVSIGELRDQLDMDFVQHVGTPEGMTHEQAADLAGAEAAKALSELAHLFDDSGRCNAERLREHGSRLLAIATALLEVSS